MPDAYDDLQVVKLEPGVIGVVNVPKPWMEKVIAQYPGGAQIMQLDKGLNPADFPPPDPAKPKRDIHQVTIRGSVQFMDYETFGDNETGTFSFNQTVSLVDPGLPTGILNYVKGFGGEERVEFDVDVVLDDDGTVIATGDVRFFEGATEGTNELEDSRALNNAVPNGGSAPFSIKLANDEDDWAIISGSLSNRVVGQA